MEKMMKKIIKFCLLAAFFAPALVMAHGPARVLLVEEIEINASPEKVWAVISDYCSIKDWHPTVTDCTADKGNEPDSVRVITLEGGEQIIEILAKYKPDTFMIQHYMKDGQELKAYPITTHSLTITITDNGKGGSILKWKGAFYRSYQGPTPPPELSDEYATEKLTVFYQTGMENIKKLSE
jgi:uncharacterized protein YndB with AHSA1/START domain